MLDIFNGCFILGCTHLKMEIRADLKCGSMQPASRLLRTTLCPLPLSIILRHKSMHARPHSLSPHSLNIARKTLSNGLAPNMNLFFITNLGDPPKLKYIKIF